MILHYLNGFRGLAVILLVFGHYSIFFEDGQDLFGPVAKIGVILFFTLSAYLLTREMLTRVKLNKEYFTNYFLKRFLRIYPVLTLTLVLLWLIPSFAKNMFGGREWSFFDNLFLIYPEGNFWAISVEFEYYIIIPVLVFLFRNKNLVGIKIILLIIISIFLYFYINLNYLIPPNYPHLLPHISPFLFGSAIAIYEYEYENNSILYKSIYSNFLVAIGVFGLLYAVPYIGRDAISSAIESEYLYHKYFANPLGVSVSSSLLLTGLIYNRGMTKKIFSLKILQYLGLISFSIYCLHILPISFQGEIFSKYGNKIGVTYLTIFTLIISSISYFLIEKIIKKNIKIIILFIKNNFKKIITLTFLLVINLISLNALINRTSYTVNIRIDMASNVGCFELYINSNYEKPLINCEIKSKNGIIKFTGIDSPNFNYRIDIGSNKNVNFKIHNIELINEKNNKLLFNLESKQISELSGSGLRINSDGEGITLDNDPRIFGNFSGIQDKSNYLNYITKIIIFVTLILDLLLLIILIKNHDLKWLSILGFLVTVGLSFPGSYNFDELYTLNEYWGGSLSDLHPIGQTILWSSLQNIMIRIGFDYPISISLPLFLQCIIFWYCAYYFANKLNNKIIKRVFLISLFVLPTFLVYNGHIGKDSQLAIALLFAITLLIKSKTNRSVLLLSCSLMPIFYAWGVRSNAPIAVIPIVIYFVILLFDYLNMKVRQNKWKFTLAIAVILFFIVYSNNIFNNTFIIKKCCYGAQMQMTPIYDMMGISRNINKNLIPSEYYSKNDYNLEDIKNNYNLYNVNWDGLIIPNLSLLRNTIEIWIKTIYQYPVEYIKFRYLVLKNFFGFTINPTGYEYMVGPYINYEKIDAQEQIKLMINKYVEFSLKYLDYQKYFRGYLLKTNNIILYKIWIYFIIVLAILITIKYRYKAKIHDQYSILIYSGIFLCLPFMILANSSHFRYLWWTAISLYFYIFIKLDSIISKKLVKNHEV